jgi:hypothetical protein
MLTLAQFECRSSSLVSQQENLLSKSSSTVMTFAASISIAGLPAKFSGVALACSCGLLTIVDELIMDRRVESLCCFYGRWEQHMKYARCVIGGVPF